MRPKIKGVKYDIVKTYIMFEDYSNYLRGQQKLVAKQCTLRSIADNIFSVKQQRVNPSPSDDKISLNVNSFDTP